MSFINDISNGVTSKLRLFADDCLIYRPIHNINDTIAFQQDLNKLHQWSTTWLMKFNTDKCHTMRIALRSKLVKANYHLGGCPLSMVSEYPYLGLTITKNMSWQTHIDNVSAKANRMLGLIRRNLRGSSQKLRQKAYQSLVRSQVEYCSSIWNPFTQKDIDKIESIQRRGARFVTNSYSWKISVSNLINDLKWESLEKRRQAASLCLMYKIHNNLVAIDPTPFISPMAPSITRSYHPDKYQPIASRIKISKFSFFPRTIKWWNALPDEVLASPTIEAFRDAVY